MHFINNTIKYFLIVLFFFFFCKASSQSCQGSLLLDANNPVVDLPSTNQYYSGNNGGYTWECWFKLNQPFGTDMQPLISSVDGVLFEDQWLGFGWQGGWFNEPVTRLVFKVDGPNSTFPTAPNCSYEPSAGFIIGTWYHAAGVMDYVNQIAELYVNGVLVDSKPITTPPITRVIPTQLGLNFGGNPLPLFGNMDEVRIWTRVLSATEIASNYDKCLSGAESNLFLYYRCNQPGGSSVADATINNNTGIFSNTPSWSTQQPVITGTACSTSSSIVSVVSSNSVICAGATVTLSVNGASSYTWSTGSNTSSISVTPLVTTSYTVSSLLPVCSGITFTNSIITVSVNPSPTITAVSYTNTTCGLNNGSIIMTSLPVGNTYTWSSGVSSVSNFVSSLSAGNYTVSAFNGVCQVSTVVPISSSIPLQILTSSITGSDCGTNNGMISITDNYTNSTYSWTPNISVSNNLNNLASGIYSLSIVNGACSTSSVFVVNQLNGPNSINVNQSNSICESTNGSISVTSVLNGTSPYQFSFNNAGFTSVSTFSNLAQGIYTISVKDANGCIYSNTYSIEKVTVTSNIELTKNFPLCDANDGSFVISNITGGTAPFLLSFNGLLFSTDTIFEELGPGSYSLVIRDSNLCETNLILEMPIDKNDYTLYVPNTFTPNKDLINDTWFAKATCINAFNCLIFNRWGEKIIELKDINEFWDGTYKGKNVPNGVYVYLIEAETNNGTVYKNGHLTLFR
jgi:gliding motility-associated-like protein